jgi:hypothetical protein
VVKTISIRETNAGEATVDIDVELHDAAEAKE